MHLTFITFRFFVGFPPFMPAQPFSILEIRSLICPPRSSESPGKKSQYTA